MTRHTPLIACVLGFVVGIGTQVDMADGAETGSDSRLLRRYTFESVSAKSPVVESTGREKESLKYGGSDSFEVVEGRTPGRKAVRLDNGAFQGKAFAPSERGCTVELWFRKHGQGSQLGNGRTNGMIFCLGSGYWDGMRLSTSYPQGPLSLEIGRPQPSSSISTQMKLPLPDGVWHHVAVTWDGTEMGIYWNGLLVATREYRGPWTPATSFKVGFAGAGIGSLKMDIDELAVYDAALSAGTIAAHALGDTPLPDAAKRLFAEAAQAARQNDWPAAEAACRALAADTALPAACQATGSIGAACALWNQNRMTESAALCAKLFGTPDTPEHLREAALRLCLVEETGVVRAAASKEVYRRLLQLPDTSPRERAVARLALAERLLADGDGAGAVTEYAAALGQESLSESEAWNTRLQMAHAYVAAGDFSNARGLYRRLATASDAPRELRSLASLGMGHSYERQGNVADAAAAFDAASKYVIVLPHHRIEALERGAELRRLAAGLPKRDPAASRTRLPQLPSPGASFYVATDGNDTAPGTDSAPFASLARARDAVAELKQSKGLPAGGVAVLVRDGVYPVDSSFSLTAADGGTADKPIVYQACRGAKPVFTGGVRVSGFTPIDPELAKRLPESSRDRVVVIDLGAQGIEDYGKILPRGFGLAGYPANPWVDLYVDGRAMNLARWPNRGFVMTGPVRAGKMGTEQAGQPGVFEFAEEQPAQWQAADDIWAFGYWGHLWAGRSVPVASIDGTAKLITAGSRASYGYKEGMPYYLFNILEELDEPGEWYLDRLDGKLYLLPPKPLADAVVEFPILAEPFLVMRDVQHVSLRGLTFELGRAEGAVMEGGANNLLAGCVFRKLGTNGVIIQGGTGHGVVGCDIHTLGAGGIRAAGGDRRTLAAGGHFIENCHIHDFTRIDRVYAPAVHLDGVGNRIAHNLFHDSPHHAMRVEGYEHAIEWNEIHSVVYESDDQAGIDMFGNPAVRGNVIRYNFWHHIGSGHNVAGQAGIRLDDFISGVLIYSNVFYRCAGGRFGAVQIHGGKNNLVDNNLFVDCKYALSFSPWGEARWLERLARDSTQLAIASGGVNIASPPHSSRYPDLATMKENPDRNYICRNLAVDCGQFSTRDRGVNELFDNHMPIGDPGLLDPAARDFRLSEDLPVYDRFDFRPIPFGQIGLYEDETRASWPVEHPITSHYVAEY